jgi:hypothetical protein
MRPLLRPSPRASLALCLCALLAGCGAGGGEAVVAPAADREPPRFLSGPTLEPNPNHAVPLAAVVRLETDEPTRVRIAVEDGERSFEALAAPELALAHAAPVVGLRAGRTHLVRVTAIDAAGNEREARAPLAFDAPALPADLPPLELLAADPARMEPGLTLFTARFLATGQGPRGNWILAVDQAGEVVWYWFDPRVTPTNVELLRNGNLLFSDESAIHEIDLLGNDLRVWFSGAASTVGVPPEAVLVDSDCFHHEFQELPEGEEARFIALSKEVRVYPSYPFSETDPDALQPFARVCGCTIVELRADGSIVRETSLLDALDPWRVCYGSLQNFWRCYGGSTIQHDWSHANTVVLDPRDGNYVVSLRHQDCLVKLERASGALVWILGDPGRWRAPWSQRLLAPVGEGFAWPYHQHAPRFTGPGRFLVFDNGVERAIPPAEPLPFEQRTSRVVEYEVDEPAGTVRQVWSWTLPEPSYSDFFGEADPLPRTGNLLVTDGAKPEGHAPSSWARILEVTRTDPPEVVFELRLRDPSGALRWGIYRSERIPSLYRE